MRRRNIVNVGVLSLLQKKGSWCLGWGNWSKPCLEDKAKSLILSSSSQAWRVGSAFWSWNWTRMIRWWVKMKYTEVGSRSMSLAKTPWRATSCFPNCFKTCKYAHVQKRSQKLWAALWTSTWAPTGTVFLTYVVTLFFGIKFLLKNRHLTPGEISSDLYRDWLWDGNFKFCLIFTNFNRFSPVLGYIWWSNTLSSLENFSINSILVFVFLMSQHDNGGFLKNAQRRASISKKTSLCFMVINTDD